MHSSLTVADYLLKRGKNRQRDGESAPVSLTPMQLIKLVYLCHGWMLGLYARPLLVDSVEAWRYGPVVAGLYHAVREFRGNPVSTDEPLSVDNGNFDKQEQSVMNQVFDIYSKYTGIQLSSMTHAPGTPWTKVSKPGVITVIPNDLIQDHFAQLAQQYS